MHVLKFGGARAGHLRRRRRQFLVTFNRMVRFSGNFSLLILMFWGNLAGAQSISQVRITGQIKNEERVTLPNTAPALVKRSVDTGRMNGGQNLGRMILQL